MMGELATETVEGWDEEDDPDAVSISFGGGGKKKDPDNQVTNDGPIPLFPDADKRSFNHVSEIRVIKLDAPNDGYRGDVAAGADLAAIGKRWGDGMYDLEAVNSKGKILKERRGVKISTGYKPASSSGAGTSDYALHLQARTADRNAARAHELHQSVNNQSREQGREYIELVKESNVARATADREFYRHEAERSQNFFTTLLSSQRESDERSRASESERNERASEAAAERHTREIERAENSHQQTMAMMGNLNTMTLAIMGKAAELNAGATDREPWVEAMSEARRGLEHLTDYATSRHENQIGKGKNGKGKDGTKRLSSGSQKNGKSKNGSGERAKMSREELLELALLKQLCDERKIDMRAMVRDAADHIRDLSDDELADMKAETDGQDDDGDESSNEQNSEESSNEPDDKHDDNSNKEDPEKEGDDAATAP